MSRIMRMLCSIIFGVCVFCGLGSVLNVDTYGYYGGSITEDFNNDGFQDIFTTSTDLETNVAYYVSDGNGGYLDKTSHAGLDGITGGSHCTQADFNNDGFTDIYIVRGGWLQEKAGKNHPNSLEGSRNRREKSNL